MFSPGDWEQYYGSYWGIYNIYITDQWWTRKTAVQSRVFLRYSSPSMPGVFLCVVKVVVHAAVMKSSSSDAAMDLDLFPEHGHREATTLESVFAFVINRHLLTGWE